MSGEDVVYVPVSRHLLPLEMKRLRMKGNLVLPLEVMVGMRMTWMD
jgi:hypothetical protein